MRYFLLIAIILLVITVLYCPAGSFFKKKATKIQYSQAISNTKHTLKWLLIFLSLLILLL